MKKYKVKAVERFEELNEIQVEDEDDEEGFQKII